MRASEIIDKYVKFFEEREHKRIENSSLVPLNDPTTLFTSSGMQPLVPYLLGEKHPAGKRLVNVQNSFRAQDIDEIGDNRHTTFFRMLGNWSLGDYFKKDQIQWFFEFLVHELQLDPEKLYITVFEGDKNIPADNESIEIWQKQFDRLGIKAEVGVRIFKYGVDKNWWSRAGTPDKMPVGEPGGPDTEVFFDFGTPHDSKFGDKCHVNCDCGRYLEIGNSVFMQYVKTSNGPDESSRSPSGTIRTRLTERSDGVKFEELPQKNVDFGGGLERLVAATEAKSDIFETSLVAPIIKAIEETSGKKYSENKRAMRIIADHLVASVFIITNKIIPTNKEQGHILRRLVRRAIRYGKQLGIQHPFTGEVAQKIIEVYSDTDPYLIHDKDLVDQVLLSEEERFTRVIQEGLKMAEKIFSTKTPIAEDIYSQIMQTSDKREVFRELYRHKDSLDKLDLGVSISQKDIEQATISGKEVFDLYQSFGFPIEMIIELAQESKLFIDVESSREEIKKHQDLSRTGAKQKFAGGLADHSEKTIHGHTATHLLHQALRDLLGNSVHQTGSNITSERVRFDFNFERKLTEDELKKIEETVNAKIKENLPVHFEMMPVAKAKEIGAIGLFDEKYAKDVKVYFIGKYSVEFCGGPHVNFTGEVKKFTIIKQESLGRGQQRIYSEVG